VIADHELGQVRPVHVWHHDVGKEQVNRSILSAGEGNRVGDVACLENPVPVAVERPHNQTANADIVLCEENRFGARENARGWALGRRLYRPGDRGQVGRDGRADPRRALNRDVSPTLVDDAVDGGEPEAGTLAVRRCREERLEGMLDDLGIHAGARVADAESHVSTLT